MDRISVIRKSVRVFGMGWLSLIPVLGLVPALYVSVCVQQIRKVHGNEWNPAGQYLRAGTVLARMGFLISAVLLFLIIAAVILS